jgi:hypothetical protein
MEILNMASQKTRETLYQYHSYQDNTIDKPFLNPESISDD